MGKPQKSTWVLENIGKIYKSDIQIRVYVTMPYVLFAGVLGSDVLSTAKNYDEEFPLWELGMRRIFTSILKSY